METGIPLGTPPAPRPRRTYRNPAALGLFLGFVVVVVYFLFTLTLVTKRGLYPLRAEDILNLGLLTAMLLVRVLVILPPLLMASTFTPDAIVYYGPGYSIHAPASEVAGTGTMWSGAPASRWPPTGPTWQSAPGWRPCSGSRPPAPISPT